MFMVTCYLVVLQELAEDEPAAGAAGGARANLQEGIGAVMDAMRDLLQNIRPVAPPVEGGEQQDNDGNGANNDGDGADDELREEWDWVQAEDELREEWDRVFPGSCTNGVNWSSLWY